MDAEGKLGTRLDIHLQVTDAACEYSEATDLDIKQNKMYSAEAADCGMSADIPIHCIDDYNVLHGITCAREQSEDVQADNAFCRQRYGICSTRKVYCDIYSRRLDDRSGQSQHNKYVDRS